MSFRVTDLRLRGILDSRGQVTIEADLTLAGGASGRGSVPRAIMPGRRERQRSDNLPLGDLTRLPRGEVLVRALRGLVVHGQLELDAALLELDSKHALGADLTLAASLAFARALTEDASLPLYAHIAALAGCSPAIPRLLVNLVSGGIHRDGPPDSFQQLMVIPNTGALLGDVSFALAIHRELSSVLGGSPLLSASSGYMPPKATVGELLDDVAAAAAALGCATPLALGIDVAAEHLAVIQGRYRLDGELVDASAMLARLIELVTQHGVVYVEDPFDPAEEESFRALLAAIGTRASVVGDDLFASDAGRVRSDLANTILLKPSQAGTLAATIGAARAARAAGLRLVVSHRSGETEDTCICDLAVGLGAELIKVGGPQRGDRISKYNQLLRLSEHVTARASLALPHLSTRP